jgi:PKD repeat protein
MAAVDGGNGGWSYVHGSTLATTSGLSLSIDEDQINDSERNHTTEQVGYVVFGPAINNDPPVSIDQSVTTLEDTSISITLSASDGDGDPLAYSIVTDPTKGTLSGTAPNLTYSPEADYNGDDSFTFKANDGTSDSNIAMVSLTIEAINDPPVANDDSGVTTMENTPVIIDVAANDSDPDGNLDLNSANENSPPSNGDMVDNGDGKCTYTPNPGFTGPDSFIYQICDTDSLCDTATVSITVTPTNDPPIAADLSIPTSEDTDVSITLTADDGDGDLLTYSVVTDPTKGTLSGSAPNLAYTPNPDDNGEDSFTFVANDGLADSNIATVIITITPIDDPIVAHDDNATTAEDNAVTIDVTANDSNLDGDLNPASTNTTCTGCSNPINGNLVNNGDGSFNYTPAPNFNGSDSFVYEVCDVDSKCDTATVTITITAVNDPSVANDDSTTTVEDTAVTINVAANDSDIDGDLNPASANTTCTGCSGPTNGILTNNNDGTFTYTPNLDFNGTDSFVYGICDILGLCDTATVTITVDAVNDPPVANADTATTTEDTPVIIDVAANDSDPDGNLDPNSANENSTPSNGTLDNNGDGTCTYTPNSGFTGPDSFTYQICDLEGLCDTASVSITVNPSAPNIFEVRVSTGYDDAEESSSGSMSRSSGDLELVDDGGSRPDQTVGMRFNGVEIPQGATITNAYVQFQVDEADSEETSLQIRGQDTDNAATFSSSSNNISNRPKTTASVSWAPPPWNSVGAAGPDQRTPDISWVIQEIVDRSGWGSGNSLAIIITGSGQRTAESYNGSSSAAPLLHVEYSMTGSTPGNTPPLASFTATPSSGDAPLTVNFNASTSNDSDGTIVSYMWDFDDGSAGSGISANHVFSAAGTYSVTLTVTDNDGGKNTTNRTVTVTGAVAIDVRVSASYDDAEEKADGSMSRSSSDLELVYDGSNQKVGLRFNGVTIPKGATITYAYVQFQVDESNSGATSLTIQGENADNALTFSSSSGIQEIVGGNGWSSGNSLVIIITGTGERTAESYDGSSSGAPLLHVEYTI